jgi:hypothetical protein
VVAFYRIGFCTEWVFPVTLCILVWVRNVYVHLGAWDAIHQLLNIILKLRILVLLLVSTLPYVVKVKNYS